jgi:hypothetical protein
LARRLNGIQSAENFCLVGWMEESLHVRKLPSGRRTRREKMTDHPWRS